MHTENVTNLSILGAIGQFGNNPLIGYKLHFDKQTGLRIVLTTHLKDVSMWSESAILINVFRNASSRRVDGDILKTSFNMHLQDIFPKTSLRCLCNAS